MGVNNSSIRLKQHASHGGVKQKNHSIAKEDNDIIGEESQEDNENSDNASEEDDDVLRPPSEDENIIENVDFSVFLD